MKTFDSELQQQLADLFAATDKKGMSSKKAREFTRAKKRLIMKTTRRGGVPLSLDRKGTFQSWIR